MKKIVVPDGMYLAALPHQDSGTQCSAALEAALRWLSENPIVPTDEQIQATCAAISEDWRVGEPFEDTYRDLLVEWQRKMFLAPEPEMIGSETVGEFCSRFKTIAEAATEAYKLGKQSK